jgi:hypothetical protein
MKLHTLDSELPVHDISCDGLPVPIYHATKQLPAERFTPYPVVPCVDKAWVLVKTFSNARTISSSS